MARPMRRRRLAATTAGILGGLVAVSGCDFTGAGSLPLPFAAGTGSESYTITVEMPDASNLVPNSEVKVNDVTVGTVRRIAWDNWHARLTVGLDDNVWLPANAVATVGQKSLLGADYLQLSSPGQAPDGQLHAGDVIPLARSGRYPETEDVLGALSLVLNGGGLSQINTITTELNHVLNGRAEETRQLLGNLTTFVSTLNNQRGDIVKTIDSLNRFGRSLAKQNRTLATAIDQIPSGLKVLNDERDKITSTLTAVARLGSVATKVINSSRQDLASNLEALHPILRKLADAGDNLPQSLAVVLTFPFPGETVPNFARGDYANLFVTLDLRMPVLYQNLVRDLPVLGSLLPVGGGQRKVDPLTAPIVPGQSGSSDTGQGQSPAPRSGDLPGLPSGLLGGGKK